MSSLSLPLLRFVEPPVLNMGAVVEDSSCRTPLIFVLSPGVVSTVYSTDCTFMLLMMF